MPQKCSLCAAVLARRIEILLRLIARYLSPLQVGLILDQWQAECQQAESSGELVGPPPPPL